MYLFYVEATSNQFSGLKANEGSRPNVLKRIYSHMHTHHILHTVRVHARALSIGKASVTTTLKFFLWSPTPPYAVVLWVASRASLFLAPTSKRNSIWSIFIVVQLYMMSSSRFGWNSDFFLIFTISNNLSLFSGLPATSWQISILNTSTLNSKCKDRSWKNFVWSTLWRCIFN